MSEPREVRDLVGDDVPAEELRELERVDSLLRSVPAPPPHVPESLTRAVLAASEPIRLWTRRRTLAALALAATVAAVSFAVGTRVGGEDFDARMAVPMRAMEDARGASGVVRVGERKEHGNWGLELEVSGLRELPPGGYYALWLAKDGKYAATCGTFRVGPDGAGEFYWNVSYRLADYDAWVVTAYLPNQPRDAERPWLLTAKIAT